MGYLVRMINKEQNWAQYQQEIPAIDQINADSISELATTDNCVSTWYIDTKEDINQAVLALTSGFRNLDSIKLVVLNMDSLKQYGLVAKQSEETAFTKAKGYEKYHYDIIDLNHHSLGSLAQFIMKTLHDNGVINVDKPSIVEILSKAMAEEIVDFDSLDKNLKAGLASSIIKELRKPKSKLAPIVNRTIQEQLQQQVEKNKRRTNCSYETQCPYWQGA